MKPEIQKIWVQALESGKYKQTSALLFDGECHCSNGVLCQLFLDEHGESWQEDHGYQDIIYYEIDGHCDIVPGKVLEWAGINLDLEHFISSWNDNGGTFQDIAKYIRGL